METEEIVLGPNRVTQMDNRATLEQSIAHYEERISEYLAAIDYCSTGSGIFQGSHPFEIVRDTIVLSVHAAEGGGFRLRLRARRHDFVTPWLIAMATGLVEACVQFEMLHVRQHVLFASGQDWVGVADDDSWLSGSPVWPKTSGILNTIQNSFTTSELAHHPDVLRRIRWFRNRPILQPL